MDKKYKISILISIVIIAGAFIFIWAHKKTKEISSQLNLQAEMQSKVNEQQDQIDQQRAQIDELIKFKEDQQKENEKTPEKPIVINQSGGGNKTNTGSTSDINNLKKQQKCQEDINKYNECVSEHNAQMAEYSACLAEHAGERLIPCINPGRYSFCSQPDC